MRYNIMIKNILFINNYIDIIEGIIFYFFLQFFILNTSHILFFPLNNFEFESSPKKFIVVPGFLKILFF